jgi:hypothetical protein
MIIMARVHSKAQAEILMSPSTTFEICYSLVETIVLTATWIVVSTSLSSTVNLAELSPHPLWLPVILASARYGVASGLIAAIAAIGASAITGWPEQTAFDDAFGHNLAVWAQPALWLIAALVLGEYRDAQRRRDWELTHELAVEQERGRQVGAIYRSLESHVESLERYLAAAKRQSAQEAFDQLGLLASSRGQSVGPALGTAVDMMLGPQTEYQVYGLRDRKLVALPELCRGETSSARVHQAGSALFDEAISRKRSMSVLRPMDVDTMHDCGVFAAPVTLAGDSTPTGVIVISFVEASKLNATTEVILRSLAAELAHPLNELLGVEQHVQAVAA